jgi:3-hydroxyacyl-[acyl-carrier-protein] dehydratase
VKFNLIDRIEELSDTRIVGVKQVSLAEEYLADHFPTFPVLPGVMMLEAATQAAGWLLHHRTNFACSMAVLKEARNVKYGQFVAPGDELRLEVELTKPLETGGVFKISGTVGAKQSIGARLEIAYFNLASRDPAMADTDRKLLEHSRARWALLALTLERAASLQKLD